MTQITDRLRGLLRLSLLAVLLPVSGVAQELPPPVPPQPQLQPPPPPPVTDVLYFVAENGTSVGPFNMAQLQGRVATGGLRADSQVWTQGMTDWVAAGTVAALAPLFAAAPVQPPEPALDYSAFIAGSWETSGPVTLGDATGNARTVTTYKPDRSFEVFSQGEFSNWQGPFQTRITGQGTYTVHTIANGQFELRLTGTQVFEILGFGSGGQVSAYSPVFRLTVIDQNTIRTETGEIVRRIGF